MTIPDSLSELSAQGKAFIDPFTQHQPTPAALNAATQDKLYAMAVQTLKASQYPQAFALFAVLFSQNTRDGRYLSGMAHATQGGGDMSLALQLHTVALVLALAVSTEPEPYVLDLAQALIDIQSTAFAKVLLELIGPDSKFAGDAAQLTQRALAVEALLEHAA